MFCSIYGDVSRRIHRINILTEQEIGEVVITKKGHCWRLIPDS